MQVDVTVETDISRSARARQLEAMFDVPEASHQRQQWTLDAPLHEREWNIGLIVGPSGAGKTVLLRDMFGQPRDLQWETASVIDAFDSAHSMADVAKVCQAVGFNTIPAWLRPYHVLSNGEQFRVAMARLMLESEAGKAIPVDEFTSVVDRQVAQIAAHAVAKHVRRTSKQLVAATCHYDVLDWLQPDWVIEPATRTFTWRSVQPRPRLHATISAVSYSAWQLFAPFHYLTAALNKAARCYCLFINEQPAAFAAVLHRPHPKRRDIKGVSRLVTLPDWQGLGLAFVLVDTLGAAYRAAGFCFRTYPAHPALINGFDKSERWSLRQRPGFAGRPGATHGPQAKLAQQWRAGSRPCAVFQYVGEPEHDEQSARALIAA